MLVQSEENSDSQKSVTADCPTGKSIMGGGAAVFAPGGSLNVLSMIESRPVGAAWKARAIETAAGTDANWSLEVRAICVTLGG